jgi:tRNA(Ile)-lysidine synthase
MREAVRLVEQVRSFWSRLERASGPVVVALSGGPDSVALFLALREVIPGPLVLAHLNHQLRGADSDADEAFVRDLHGAWRAAGDQKLTLHCERREVALLARSRGENLESAARRIRYGWLLEVAQEHGCPWVATGHTADDQAETVLHRLLRGTGLKGLRGIAPRRPLAPEVEVVRPLLRVRRAEVLAFLVARGQAFRQDSSNTDLRFTRNRLRHELLPHLAARYNPAVVEVLCRLAEQAEDTYQAEETAARALWAAAELPRAGPLLVFDRQRLAAEPRHRIREVFRLAWAREGWPLGGMGFADWERLTAVALGEMPRVDLPGKVRACCRPRVVQVGPQGECEKPSLV